MQFKSVVTCFLQSEQGILLLRRTGKVGTYQGRWAGVSGYLEPNEAPLQRAKTEILEEVGLDSELVSLLRSGEPLRVVDDKEDTVWVIHPFLFEVHGGSIRLDREHSEHKWVNPEGLRSYETVPRLREAFERVRWNLSLVAPSLSRMDAIVDALAEDRMHGASYLGHRSVEILARIAALSSAESAGELFRDLLSFALKLRKAQPSMATIRNLTGMVMHEIATVSSNLHSVDEFREAIISSAEKVRQNAMASAEDAARNSVALFPDEGHVLTHSYSSTVKRALVLATRSQHRLVVYATESSPGLEGKQLASDLVKLRIPVRLIADSAVNSVISDVDLVLVGADTIRADGSVVNKVGTANIATAASEIETPFFVACEEAKFSTQDLLGEPVEIPKSLFDITPSEHVSAIVTEEGRLEPRQVERRIRTTLSQLYP